MAALLAFSLLASCGAPDPAAASHQRMLAVLSDISERAERENMWVGDRAARNARRIVAAQDSETDPLTRFQALHRLGEFEGRLGHDRAAIEAWQAAYDLLPHVRERLPKTEPTELVFRLGLSHLRLGEAANCCARNVPESCLLPFRGDAIHIDPEGSLGAIRFFEELLERYDGEHLRARWLLNVAHMTLGSYPDGVAERFRIPPEALESGENFPQFTNISKRLGLDVFDLFGGVVVDDFDGDGLLDILNSTWDPTGPMHLFRNQGDGSFADLTTEASLDGLLGGVNMVQADYDNDGDRDVYVIRGAWLQGEGRHPNSLLRNNGDGTFTDVTFLVGMGEEAHPTLTASWADYDNDGFIDLFVGNETTRRNEGPCQLFHNNGDGTFTDVAAAAGVQNFELTRGIAWGDFDGDRLPDLYVSNLGAANRLYRNNGDGTFTDLAAETGTDEPIGSFPTWFFDYDNDGNLDLYVPSYHGKTPALDAVAAGYFGVPDDSIEPPRLFRGDGKGGFSDQASEAGLDRIHLPMGANFGDIDGDGFLDIYLGTGYPDFEALMPNVMYRNVAGRTFVDVTSVGGFGHLQKGHGIAFADFDHDGDQDLFAQMGGAFPGDRYYNALFENPGFDNHWLTVELVGVRSNRAAIGARIRVVVTESGRERSIYKHVNSGGSFGASPLRQTIGLGRAERIERVEIYWPTSDYTQRFEVDFDRAVRVVEFEDAVQELMLPRFDLAAAVDP